MPRLLMLILLMGSPSVHGALLGRAPLTPGGADYQAYYDTDLDITWLADVTAGPTTQVYWVDVQGRINLVNQAGFLGFSDWRLPHADPVNGIGYDESFSYDGRTDQGYNLSAPGSAYPGSPASELAHLYYVTLANSGSYDTTGDPAACPFCPRNLGPFGETLEDYGALTSNAGFWTDAAFLLDPEEGIKALIFEFSGGLQRSDLQGDASAAVWLVRDGDVAVVPGPPGFILLATALGLLGSRRLRTHPG